MTCLRLTQPVGHPGPLLRECLVNRRIRLNAGLIKPHQDRLGFAESANPASSVTACSAASELALGIPRSVRALGQVFGDFPQIAFLERDLGEKGMRLSRRGFQSKPLLERRFRLAVKARSDCQSGFPGGASGCDAAPDPECEEQREHDPRDRGRDPCDLPPARPISRNHCVTG